MRGEIIAVCISKIKGTGKKQIQEGELIENYGLKGDVHAGHWHRQVSLLAWEEVEKFEAQLTCPKIGKRREFRPGDFAENLTVKGLKLDVLPVGTQIQTDRGAVLEITQIGKRCHYDCEIRKITGKCIMPQKGTFAKVVKGGKLRKGEGIFLRNDKDRNINS